jgi:excisionase family DNA binding protein
MENTKKVLSPLEVSTELGCSRKTVYSMLKKNQIPHVKVGDMYMIPVSAFEKWLLECNQVKTGNSGS